MNVRISKILSARIVDHADTDPDRNRDLFAQRVTDALSLTWPLLLFIQDRRHLNML